MIDIVRSLLQMQERRDRAAFRWWVIFERARLYEIRRGNTWTASMAEPELAAFESQMSRTMLIRARMAKLRHACRAIKRQRGGVAQDNDLLIKRS